MKVRQARLLSRQSLRELELQISEFEREICDVERELLHLEPRNETEMDITEITTTVHDAKKRLIDTKTKATLLKTEQRRLEIRFHLLCLGLALFILACVTAFGFLNYLLVSVSGLPYSITIPSTTTVLAVEISILFTIRRRRRASSPIFVERPRVIRPPLTRLDRIARFFWSAKTYERVFAPARADLIREWLEAEAAGERKKAWFIKQIRAPFIQLSHMGAQLPWSFLKRIIEILQARTGK